MTHGATSDAIGGIDHLVIAVSDLDRAAQAYRRLGFTLSPRAVHSAHMGTANHTIMLARDYFEVLGVLAPTKANARWRNALAQGEGLAGFAAATTSLTAAGAAWRQAGFTPSEVIDFSRPVERQTGVRMQARFEVVTLPADALPAMSIFACAQLTREAVWLPELLQHPNTARAIRRLAILAPDPGPAAARWARALPGAVAATIAGGTELRIGSHRVDFIHPAHAADRYGLAGRFACTKAIAIELEVADIGACREALRRGSITPQTRGESLVVRPGDACGVAIAFAPGGA
jgi:catechol 2,3-dioxygenase-like lactoylglutathione lyase family enzyme